MNVSVIIPIYNQEKYLEQTIASVLAQTMTDFELLLIDDGSKDASALICLKSEEADRRIRYFRKENGGVSSARNYGLTQASGKYVLFMDADDLLETDCLEKCYHAAENDAADAVEFGYKKYSYTQNGDSALIGEIVPLLTGSLAFDNDSETPDILLSMTMPPVWTHLFRREIIRDISFPMIPTAEDIIFVMRVFSRAKKITFLKETLYHYSVRIGSCVNKYQPTRAECEKLLLQNLHSLLTDWQCSENTAERVLREYRIRGYLNIIYNLILPDCPLTFRQKRIEMQNHASDIGLDEFRKKCYLSGGRAEKLKAFLIRHRAEILMLRFGFLAVKFRT